LLVDAIRVQEIPRCLGAYPFDLLNAGHQLADLGVRLDARIARSRRRRDHAKRRHHRDEQPHPALSVLAVLPDKVVTPWPSRNGLAAAIPYRPRAPGDPGALGGRLW